MNKLLFPESFVKLVLPLKDNFTKPSFEYFKVLISSILLGHPKKTVTAGIRLMKPLGHFSNSCRFLSQYKWDLHQLSLSVFRLILSCLSISSPILLALDDTLIPKYGKKIFGRSFHFDHANKPNRPRYIKGHNWVLVGLLHFSSLFSKWLCFPFLADLYIPQDKVPKDRDFRTRIQIAVDLVKKIHHYLNQRIIVVADGLYAKKNLVRSCIKEDITFISRLRSDAKLYHSPIRKKKAARGRPLKYGKPLPSLNELASDKASFKKYRLKLYGEMHLILIKSFRAIWKPADAKVKVLAVYFEDAKTPNYFFCTDLSLSDTRIVELVAARWSIETIFTDLKEHLGMGDWQCRLENSVLRSVPLTCIGACLLILWSLQQAQLKEPEFWDVNPWYHNKASPSVYDMIQQLKAKCISKTIFDSLPKGGIDKQNLGQIEQFLRICA